MTINKTKRPSPKWENQLHHGLAVLSSLQIQLLDEVEPKTAFMGEIAIPFLESFFTQTFANGSLKREDTAYIGILEDVFIKRFLGEELSVAYKLMLVSRLQEFTLNELLVREGYTHVFMEHQKQLIKELHWVTMSNPVYLRYQDKYITCLKKNVAV